MRRGGLMIWLLLLRATCLAAPWSYELPIGDGYSITVTTMYTACARDGRTVLNPGDYPGISSLIDQYATTRDHIFIQNYTTFFILAKADDSVIGPLSESDFARHPAVLASGPLKWRVPRHPHTYSLGLMFLLINPLFVLPAAFSLFIGVLLLLATQRLIKGKLELSP